MQTSGKRARLRSVALSSRPFFRLPCDCVAAFDKEVEAIENGSHQRLQEGLGEIRRRKAELIASAEAWRNDRIMNIENEFDGAIKAALDQYNEDVRHLRTRLIDEVKRNRRRYIDTNGITSPQLQRKKARMPSTMQAASTRSSAAAMQSQQKPVAVRVKLSDDEIRSDLKKISKPFTAAATAPNPSPRLEFVRVIDDVLYIGNFRFQIGDRVRCGRHDDIKSGIVDRVSETDVEVTESELGGKYLLPLSFLRTGMASIEHHPGTAASEPIDDVQRLDNENGVDRRHPVRDPGAKAVDSRPGRAGEVGVVTTAKQD